MNTAETISINPVSKTLGALNPEATLKFLEENARRAKVRNGKRGFSFSKLFFSSTAPRVSAFSGRMFIFRLLFATLLIISGSLILSGEIVSPVSLLDPELIAMGEIIAGGMLALGFMSRLTMGITAVVFGWAAVMQTMAGVFDMQLLLCCLGAGMFMVMGAGRYSTDFLIRKGIVLHKQHKEKKLRENRLSYRAYRIHTSQF